MGPPLVLFSLPFPLSASLSIQQATLGRVSQRSLSDGLIGNHTSRRDKEFTHLHRGSLTVAEKIRGDYYYYFNYAPFFVSFSLKAESRWRCASVSVCLVCVSWHPSDPLGRYKSRRVQEMALIKVNTHTYSRCIIYGHFCSIRSEHLRIDVQKKKKNYDTSG